LFPVSGIERRHLPYLKVNEESSIFMPNSAVWFLFPVSGEVETAVNEWLEWESTVLAPNLAHVIGAGSKNEKVKSSLTSAFKKLNEALRSRPYLTQVIIFKLPSNNFFQVFYCFRIN
jgi:methionyl-tRNA synthetase